LRWWYIFIYYILVTGTDIVFNFYIQNLFNLRHKLSSISLHFINPFLLNNHFLDTLPFFFYSSNSYTHLLFSSSHVSSTFNFIPFPAISTIFLNAFAWTSRSLRSHALIVPSSMSWSSSLCVKFLPFSQYLSLFLETLNYSSHS